MRKLYAFLFIGIFMIPFMNTSQAQADYRIQSVFLYNFTRLVAWPASYQSGDFVVAVYGNSPMMQEVQEMADTKRAGNQAIVAKNFRNINDIEKCHILYVPSSQSRRIEEIVSTLRAKNIHALVVTDTRNGTNNGAVINFTVVDRRQRFEMSQDNARAMGLNPGGEIARLAIIVD